MNQISFLQWLKQRNYEFTISLLLFPDNPDEAIAFEFQETADSKGVVSNLQLTFYVRADHPEKCIECANKINSDLDMITKLFIDDNQIILIKSLSSVPVPLGIDENNRHIFQIQFKVLVSPSDKLNVKE